MTDMPTSQRAERHHTNQFSVLSGNTDDSSASAPPLANGGGGADGPNDAAWIETYISGAAEPFDFSPVKRRIRDLKLAAIEAENLKSEKAAIEIAAKTGPIVLLPSVHDPWEATDEK